jgi:hypothetical protein
MSPGTGFVVFLAVTLALLGCVVHTGMNAQRRRHVPLVVLAVASLATTIRYAEMLGPLYDLEGAGLITPVHLTFAYVTSAAYLLPLVTGPLAIKRPELIPWHRRVAWVVVALTVLTAATGSCMLLVAERLPDPS